MIIRTTRAQPVQTDPNNLHAERIDNLRRLVRDELRGGDEWRGRPFNRAVGAAIRNVDDPSLAPGLRDEISSLAGDVANCGMWNLRFSHDMKARAEVFHCDRWLLCNACANRRAWRYALHDSARVMEVYAADPSLRFLMLTLTVGESEDLAHQYELLTSCLSKLGDRRSGAWGAVRGMIWFIEYARGVRGKWRAHAHAIVAVHDSSSKIQRALLLGWVKATSPGLDADGRLDALVEQHSEEFWTHERDVQGFAGVLLSLGRDALAISAYASKRPSLSIEDRLEAFALVGGRRSRQPTGVFWGHKESVLEARLDLVGRGALSIRGERGATTPADGPRKTRARELYERKLARQERHREWKRKVRLPTQDPLDGALRARSEEASKAGSRRARSCPRVSRKMTAKK